MRLTRERGRVRWLLIVGLFWSGAAFLSAEASAKAEAPPVRAQARSITVSVAASLADVLTELATRYEAAGGPKVHLNLGGSNALARQIVEGAPVDAFVSADELQMDVVGRSGRLVAGSRRPLLANQLVIIVPTAPRLSVIQPHDLTSSAVRRVAMGNPDAVPAGVYGRQWLEQLKLWAIVQPKVVPLPTVRAALAAVREGRADAGIVYATDARTSSDVRVDYRVPDGAGPAIVYPAAVLMGPRQTEAARFLAFLHGPEARRVFETAGFRVFGAGRGDIVHGRRDAETQRRRDSADSR